MSSIIGKKRVTFDEASSLLLQPIAIKAKPLDNIDVSILLEPSPEKPVRSRFDSEYEMHVKKYIGLVKNK